MRLFFFIIGAWVLIGCQALGPQPAAKAFDPASPTAQAAPWSPSAALQTAPSLAGPAPSPAPNAKPMNMPMGKPMNMPGHSDSQHPGGQP